MHGGSQGKIRRWFERHNIDKAVKVSAESAKPGFALQQHVIVAVST